MSEINSKSLFYPPGGILLWILIYVELFTYGLALFGLAFYASQERAVFHADSALLNKGIGTVNTLFLLSSGFLIAKAVRHFKAKNFDQSLSLFNWAMLFGLGFLILKLVEYGIKIEAGIDLNYSTFYMFYWLLTGFHWIHVLVGMVILFFVRLNIKKRKEEAKLEDIEAGAAFWHMCDIIWLFLFPALYLLI